MAGHRQLRSFRSGCPGQIPRIVVRRALQEQKHAQPNMVVTLEEVAVSSMIGLQGLPPMLARLTRGTCIAGRGIAIARWSVNGAELIALLVA